jgi:hypothetical protein
MVFLNLSTIFSDLSIIFSDLSIIFSNLSTIFSDLSILLKFPTFLVAPIIIKTSLTQRTRPSKGVFRFTIYRPIRFPSF